MGGSSNTRPFGTAVLDGYVQIFFLCEVGLISVCSINSVDLDIEGGSTTFYDSFVNQIRSHAAGASKRSVVDYTYIKSLIKRIVIARYYITAAPQCPFPDAYLGTVLNAVGFDAVYVQFCV